MLGRDPSLRDSLTDQMGKKRRRPRVATWSLVWRHGLDGDATGEDSDASAEGVECQA